MVPDWPAPVPLVKDTVGLYASRDVPLLEVVAGLEAALPDEKQVQAMEPAVGVGTRAR